MSKEETTQILQENAIMVGFCTNILLDRLEILSSYRVVWAKELKRFGNMFRAKLEETEKRIWLHIGENQQQDNFFAVAAQMDKVLAKITTFNNEQILTLMQAIESIEKGEILEVENEQELSELRRLKQSK